MSINNLNTYLNVRDAHLRVVSGNVYAQAMNIGGINVETAHGLQSVSDTGNVTSNTLQFSNATTGFVTTANAQIGRDLVVTGNATVSTDLTVSANATVTDTLTISEHLLASKEATITGNLNVTTVMSDSNVVAEYTGPHDRPLRKYPEVALTQNDESATSGYVASASSTATYDTNLQPKNAFNGVISPSSGTASWQSSDSGYSGTTPFNYLNAGTHTVSLTDTDGTVHYGDWLSLQTPNRIKVSYYKIHTLNDVDNYRPDSFVLLGSNSETDGTWKLLHTETSGMTDPGPEVYTGHVNSTEFYTYHRLLVKSLAGNGGEAYINELEYYGYEEGSGSLDTTLKTVYNVPATTGTQLEVYYDGQDYTQASDFTGSDGVIDKVGGDQDGTASSGVSFDSTYKAFVFDGTANGKITGTHGLGTGTGIQYSMSLWFKADVLSGNHRLATFGTQGTQYQSSTLLIYQNDIHLDHWLSEIKTTSDILVPNVWYHLVAIHTGPGTEDVSQNALYLNGVKLEDVTTGGSAANGTFNLQGTGLTIGADSAGTNPFNGSIANFRLYSKALNADQVKELYDYQKDYFLGSKSQVTLYKGHLGVGVTEPSGQLELAGDERIQEYPPRALTGYSTHIEGHGVFKVEGDTFYTPTNPDLDPWRAFNDDITANLGRWRQNSSQFTAGGGPIDNRRYAEGLPNASWLVLHLPYDINLKGYSICPQNGQSPGNVQIWGSSDGGTSWSHLHSQTQPNGDNTTYQNYTISHEGYYSKIAYLILTLTPSTATEVSIRDMKYFGTPGPTTLDKGSLSLTRSLDVPRVSRYDVDTETPRPEKLVLDFDTTVNSSPTDISGQGNHGAFFGSASYSAADKAFNSPNSAGILVRGSTLGSGAQPLTLCAWAKGLGEWNATANDTIIAVGPNSSSGHSSFQLCVNTDAITLDMASASNFVEYPVTITNHRWYFIAMTYTGGDAFTNTRVYVDGVEIAKPASWTNGSSGTLSLPSSPDIGVGTRTGNGSGTTPAGYLAGQISNPKIYSVALEPSEVRKLYNLGRTGRSMVISDTAVGIGKVPEAQLDVRGSLRCDVVSDFLKIDRPGTQLSISRSDVYKNEFRWYAWSSGCNWFTPYTGKSIYIGRDGETLNEFNFHNVTAVKKGSSTLHSSDDRLKRDETFITNATDTLLKLKPQTYIKKHRLPENENDTDIPEQFEAGLIAQDVWYDAPELRFLVHPSEDANPSETKPISPDPNDPTQDPDYSSWGTTQAYVNYEGFLPYLIKAAQEQYEKTQSIKSELNLTHELQNENNRLKNKVAILENRQTHFNTLLVNLIGRIEALERGA